MDGELKGVFVHRHSASLDNALKEVGLVGFLKLRRHEGVRFRVHWQGLEGCAAGYQATRIVKLQRTAHI